MDPICCVLCDCVRVCVPPQHMRDDLAVESFQLSLAEVQAIGKLIGEVGIQALLDLS